MGTMRGPCADTANSPLQCSGLGQGWGWLDYATLGMMGGAAAELEQSWGRAGEAGLQQRVATGQGQAGHSWAD